MTAVNRRQFLSIGGAAALTAALPGRAFALPRAESSSLTVGMPTDVVISQIYRFTKEHQMIWRTVFDYLVDKRLDGGYNPRLATEWNWNADHSRLVLKLRPDVVFHSGRAFGPEDVVAT